MLDDLVELATTAIHREHSPDISHPISSRPTSSSSSTMPPRRRRGSNSQSVSSASADVNGMPPPAVPLSKSPSPVATRHRRSRSGASPPASPRQLASALITRPKQEAEKASPVTFVAVALISLVLSSGLRTAASTYTTLGRAEIAAISDPKHSQDEYYIGGLLLWRIFVLAVYWFAGYDGTSSCHILCRIN